MVDLVRQKVALPVRVSVWVDAAGRAFFSRDGSPSDEAAKQAGELERLGVTVLEVERVRYAPKIEEPEKAP